jgi:metallo-beta-lactamase class B
MKTPYKSVAFAVGLLAVVLPGLAFGQKGVPEDAQAHLDAAKALATKLSAKLDRPIRACDASMADRMTSDERDGPRVRDRTSSTPPLKVFDDVYYVGLPGVGSYVIKTSEGLVLIDSLYNKGNIENILIPSFKTLGLDPKDIKHIFITHGHGDHDGGAQYLRDTYGPHVYMTAEDYDLPRGKNVSPEWGPKPARDQVLTDGQVLKVGDRTFTFVKVPGHTPGQVSIIFPVTVNGVPHVAANWTGSLPAEVKGAQEWADSNAKFKQATAKANVDIAISNHAGSDLQLLADYAKAPPGGKHPLVIGEENYQDLLTMNEECGKAMVSLLKAKGKK